MSLPCCHQRQFEAFSRILYTIKKEQLIDILIKKLNETSSHKKRARIGLEVVFLLYHWSFLGDTCGWIDFMPGPYYERVKNDLVSLSSGDAIKIKKELPDSPPKYFLAIQKLGVAHEILEDYLSYCYVNKFQRVLKTFVQFNLSPKPKIDLDKPFHERWKL